MNSPAGQLKTEQVTKTAQNQSSPDLSVSSPKAAETSRPLRENLKQKLDPAKDKVIANMLGPDPGSKKGVQAPVVQQQNIDRLNQTINNAQKKDTVTTAPRNRAQRNQENSQDHGTETVEHERQDQVAFRYVGAKAPNQGTKQKSTTPWGDQGPEESMKISDPGAQRDGVDGPTISSRNNSSGTSSVDSDHESQSEANAAVGGLGSGVEADIGPDQELSNILDLVGPEAVQTLTERLNEVWVQIDAQAVGSLDVLARLPAGLNGQNSVELLMVESPQSVFFLAFLKNRNDFEVISTFDRRALLPGDPTKQLAEAAMISYTQTATMFDEAAANLSSQVTRLAEERDDNPLVFEGVRQQWVMAKRRGRKLRGINDQLADKLDELATTDDFLVQRDIQETPELSTEELEEGREEDIEESEVVKQEIERPVLGGPEDNDE